MTIYIGAGHGGTAHGLDVGAVANNTTEFAEVFTIYNALKARKTSLAFVAPQLDLAPARIPWINKNLRPDDVQIELHLNSADPMATGATMYYLGGNEDRRKEAEIMITRYCDKTGQNSRGAMSDTSTRFKRLGVIRDVKCHSFLLEMGFITNALDLSLVRNRAVEAILSMCGVVPEAPAISPWAQLSWDKALKKGIISATTNPQEIIGNTTLEYILRKANVINTVLPEGMTVERMIVCLDNMGKLS